MRKQTPTRIAFFGNFGSTNFGNEATLVAIVARLRLLFPTCELYCVCSFPASANATYGIDAVPHTIRSSRLWDRQARPSKRAWMTLSGLGEELREYLRAWRVLEGTDLLIVPGTGLLTDAYGLMGWGPYGLLRWSLVARLRRCRIMFVSVGAGPIHTAPGRLLLKSALSLAEYRSYRDAPSRETVRNWVCGEKATGSIPISSSTSPLTRKRPPRTARAGDPWSGSA